MLVENYNFLRKIGEIDDDGLALAIIDVIGAHPWEKSEMVSSCANYYATGYWAWEIQNVRKIIPPIKATLARGIYSLKANTIDKGSIKLQLTQGNG